jgi:hypothetical protein
MLAACLAGHGVVQAKQFVRAAALFQLNPERLLLLLGEPPSALDVL